MYIIVYEMPSKTGNQSEQIIGLQEQKMGAAKCMDVRKVEFQLHASSSTGDISASGRMRAAYIFFFEIICILHREMEPYVCHDCNIDSTRDSSSLESPRTSR